MAHKISVFSLVLLIVAAIDSIRNLPAAALFGTDLIFFFVISALIFLIPTSLVAAELTSLFPDKGGVYHWVKMAFGEKSGMLAIWLQWINTMVWYPTILSFIAGTLAYLFDPLLACNKVYLLSVILLIFWGLTFLNLLGIKVSTKVNTFCTLIGMVFPIVLLLVLGAVWVFSGEPVHIHVNAETLIPSLGASTQWVALIAIMASFLGMELAGVHVADIREPQRNFPKAVLLSSAFILFTMLFGSLSIAFVLPADQINLVAGVMQVFANFFEKFHLSGWLPVLTVLIVVGSIGGLINWVISPAKGLLHAAEYRFLPPYFVKTNRHGVASRILIGQGIVVTLFCLGFLLHPTINAVYWFLTALSTGLYMLMYVLMFLAAIKLHYKYIHRPKAFKIPGKDVGVWTTCVLGLIGCTITLVVGFFPPDHIHIESVGTYALTISLGFLGAVLPVFYFYKRRKSIS